tara:strand:+ start:156 stop:455 length:300 start_codon:yes stop_codon:yes gene_type:complete
MAIKTIPNLTVTTDEHREQWVKMIHKCSDYHFDCAGQFTPEIIGDDSMEEVATIHRAWGRALQEAAELIEYWEVEEEVEVLVPTAKGVKNITKEIDNDN